MHIKSLIYSILLRVIEFLRCVQWVQAVSNSLDFSSVHFLQYCVSCTEHYQSAVWPRWWVKGKHLKSFQSKYMKWNAECCHCSRKMILLSYSWKLFAFLCIFNSSSAVINIWLILSFRCSVNETVAGDRRTRPPQTSEQISMHLCVIKHNILPLESTQKVKQSTDKLQSANTGQDFSLAIQS